jgi:dihydrofolate reductase
MRKLIEATFMSLDGVVDAPKLVEEAQPYWLWDKEHAKYSHKLLFAADALLLGRKTYEFFAEAYPNMTSSAPGVQKDFVNRMNNIPKYILPQQLLLRQSGMPLSFRVMWLRKSTSSNNSQVKTF